VRRRCPPPFPCSSLTWGRSFFSRDPLCHAPSLPAPSQHPPRPPPAHRSARLYGAAPETPAALHGRFTFHWLSGQRDAAVACLGALQAADPANGYLAHSLGLLAQQDGRLEAAAEHFARGAAADDLDAALLGAEGLAELHAFRGKHDDAAAAWAAGARRGLTSRFLRQWGLYEKRRRNVDAAAALFGRSAALNAQDYRTLLQWGLLEWRRGDVAAAAALFERCAAVAPSCAHNWYLYCTMAWKEGGAGGGGAGGGGGGGGGGAPSGASGGGPPADSAAGGGGGDVSAARELFRRATGHCERNAPLWMEWGLMEWGAGDPAAARALFRRGAAVPPSQQHPPLYEAWADMEAVLGDAPRAAELRARGEAVAGVKAQRPPPPAPLGAAYM